MTIATPILSSDSRGENLGDPSRPTTVHVPGMRCGGCVAKIERSLAALPEIRHVRANLSRQTVRIEWSAGDRTQAALNALEADGFPASFAVVPEVAGQASEDEKLLIKCLAVAGFASANVMLLSLSIWAGNAEDMAPETRTMFHWFSALIALPAITYAGRPFFRSAWKAVRHMRTNMDVPISIAVVVASATSLWETATGGRHAYFDSAITLLFFLLIGRLLDQRARRQVRSAAARLVALQDCVVRRLADDGSTAVVDLETLDAGDRILVAAGERFAIDGDVHAGRSSIDESAMTGEALPRLVQPGDRILAGTVNLSSPLTVTTRAVGDATVLADIVRLTDAAEQRRSAYVILADRVSRLYAPVVHLLALLAFVGWMLIGGIDWQPALMIAVAVLIITCPCALGLAVPVVQVVATGRLFGIGTLVKSGDALERLATVDTVVFDKTGTLTLGSPDLINASTIPENALRDAAALAAASSHPLSQALTRAAPGVTAREGVEEIPGNGLSWDGPGGLWRLGSAVWCGLGDRDSDETAVDHGHAVGTLWFARPGQEPVSFSFSDPLREDAAATIKAIRDAGCETVLLSGDRKAVTADVARQVGIKVWSGRCLPSDKVAEIEHLRDAGRSVMMVGDGLNDAPALAAATVSMSPGCAADIAQTSAEIVFQGAALRPVLTTIRAARQSQRLVRQNIALAIGYNMLAVPLAMSGLVTPMIAALCMSSSSILVVANAFRQAPHRRLWRQAMSEARLAV
ncbi:MAG: heavy metal translocating P-type ATPase [Rhodospirillaceae bacterium]|nr:heavy metal translocating P-type ATPase [Rhodospirillaceae bacterium]MCY4237247.1 heavy metal translocating P-type ATPase [Rhodospirillaceae bacterium]